MKRSEKIAKNKVVYIDAYSDAPKSAHYILRETGEIVRLEEYENGIHSTMTILAKFPEDSLEVSQIGETIRTSQQTIGKNVIIYLVKPSWMN